MESYRRQINELFISQSPRMVANSSDVLASILFEAFFRYGEREILIFCDRLDRTVFSYPGVVREARNYLEKQGTKLLIGITSRDPDPSPFFSLLKTVKRSLSDLEKDRIRIMHFPKMTTRGHCINFSVMDGTAYRYEPDSSKCAAIASANDTEFAGKLRRAFLSCIPQAPVHHSPPMTYTCDPGLVIAVN